MVQPTATVTYEKKHVGLYENKSPQFYGLPDFTSNLAMNWKIYPIRNTPMHEATHHVYRLVLPIGWLIFVVGSNLRLCTLLFNNMIIHDHTWMININS
jgi:hypothetical protein